MTSINKFLIVMKRLIELVFGLALLITVCSAASVVWEEKDGSGVLLFKGSQPQKIGAFDVELHYSSQNQVVAFQDVGNFGTVSKINNTDGIARFGGFAIRDYEPGLNIILGFFDYTGEGQFEIYVRELTDFDAKPIDCQNSIDTVSSTPTPLPPYSMDPSMQQPFIDRQTQEPIITPWPEIPPVTTEPLPPPTHGADPHPKEEKMTVNQEVSSAEEKDTFINEEEIIVEISKESEDSQPVDPLEQPNHIGIVIMSLLFGIFIYLYKK